MIYLSLFWTFFLIGAFTFGGGYAMLPLIQEQVTAKGWIDAESLVNFVAVSESTPGPFAVNMATYIGAEMGDIFGAVCATLGVVLPSFVIILIVAKCYDKFRSSPIVKGCMTGLKPAVVGLIAGAVLSVAKTVFFPGNVSLSLLISPATYISAGIFITMLILAFKKVHPIILICLSAGIGIAVGYLGLWSA